MRYFNRTTCMETFNGDREKLILPGEIYCLPLEIPARDFPVTHSIRITGEPDYFWKMRRESCAPYAIAMSIEDALTTKDTPREKFALKLGFGSPRLYADGMDNVIPPLNHEMSRYPEFGYIAENISGTNSKFRWVPFPPGNMKSGSGC